MPGNNKIVIVVSVEGDANSYALSIASNKLSKGSSFVPYLIGIEDYRIIDSDYRHIFHSKVAKIQSLFIYRFLAYLDLFKVRDKSLIYIKYIKYSKGLSIFYILNHILIC